jgi:hypothetical protein
VNFRGVALLSTFKKQSTAKTSAIRNNLMYSIPGSAIVIRQSKSEIENPKSEIKQDICI